MLTWARIVVSAVVTLGIALGVLTPAEAGFWGNLKRSFGTATDNTQRDGAKAANAVGEVAGGAAEAVADGAQNAADYVAGDSATTEHPAAQPSNNEPKQLSKQPKQ